MFLGSNRRQWLAGTLVMLADTPGFAQGRSWPSKPLRIVVPYPPGGSSDIIARAISQPLAEALGQSVIVENRAGANGNLGADLVAKSAPDGHTMLLCDTGALAISPSVYTKLPFDPSKDLRGVTMLAYSPHMLVVHPSVPANNLGELVALSQKRSQFCRQRNGWRSPSGGRGCATRQPGALDLCALQGWLSGDSGHHRGADPGTDEWHVGHTAPCAKRQAQGVGDFQVHPDALGGRDADPG